MPYLAFLIVTKGCSENLNANEEENNCTDKQTALFPFNSHLLIDLEDTKNDQNTIKEGNLCKDNLRINNKSFSFDQFVLVSSKKKTTSMKSRKSPSCAYPIWVRHLRCNYASNNDEKTVLSKASPLIDLSFLQSVSYELCHLYYNSKSIVRQPAPVMVSRDLSMCVCAFL